MRLMLLVAIATACQLAKHHSANEGCANGHQRTLLHLLLEIDILDCLFCRAYGIFNSALHLLPHMIDGFLNVLGTFSHLIAYLIRRILRLRLELVDLACGVHTLLVYFLTEFI